jgi:1-acyl-sn-glycerol-3-phosphate acyltransferase
VNPVLKIIYQPYKWFFAIPLVFAFTFVFGLIAILTGIILGQDAVNIVAMVWAKLCCAIVPLKVNIRGTKNYTRNTAYVVVSNHQSMADIPALHGHLGLNIKWIMKKELGEIPIFGAACRQLGCITVDRGNHEAALQSIENAKKTLSGKGCVLFFAEGTRSRDGKVMPFKKGAFRFAHETKIPILPLTIRNSYQVLPSGTFDLTPGTVEVVVHRPIHMSDYNLGRLDELVSTTRQIIADAL